MIKCKTNNLLSDNIKQYHIINRQKFTEDKISYVQVAMVHSNFAIASDKEA